MTATTDQLAVPSRGVPATLRRSIPRDEFFAGLYILGCANGLGAGILQSMNSGDWAGGFRNISIIVWLACFAGVALLLRDRADKADVVRSWDLAVGLLFVALVAIPVSAINWMAVSGLSLYILLFAQGDPSRRRGALVMLALTVPMLWSRVLFAFFAKVFLEIDAVVVAWLLGTPRAGNMVGFADGSGMVVIMPACSSLANMSLAFLCWVTAVQWTEHQPSRKDLLWCGLACASVMVVNVVRIALAGLSHATFGIFHGPIGDTVGNTLMTLLVITFTALGVRRELFSRA